MITNPPGNCAAPGRRSPRPPWPTHGISLLRAVAVSLLLALWMLVSTRTVGASQISQAEFQPATSYQFGQLMQFSILGPEQSGIEQATLYIKAPDLPGTLTVDVEPNPNRPLVADYSLDLTRQPLAPFTTVTYWWQLRDADDNIISLPEETFLYVDDRFEWQSRSQDKVDVYWTGEDTSLAQAAHDAVDNALPELQALLAAEPPNPLRIYIYPTQSDLQSALRLTGRPWLNAHARPELAVILVHASNADEAKARIENDVQHELSHLLLYQATGGRSSPSWFDEGLAVAFEASPDPAHNDILLGAAELDETIPFDQLCNGFPSESNGLYLAYAQSASLVRYIRSQYGDQDLKRMIAALRDGADCHSLTERALNVSLNELEENWAQELLPQPPLNVLWRNGAVWFVVLAAGFGFLLVLLFSAAKAPGR